MESNFDRGLYTFIKLDFIILALVAAFYIIISIKGAHIYIRDLFFTVYLFLLCNILIKRGI